MSEHIRVSEAVKATLERIRDERGHTNLDSAAREVLMKADVELETVTDKDKSVGGWTVDS